MNAVRCAIYTRKSSEEGLEQGLNSLDAQREACAANILSQASEGWSAVPDIYDDGGLSGDTLERPALQRLLAEVDAGRIDKIAASKARGMWMGGNPPVGYAPDRRSLKIVDHEAEQVRDIFQRYLRLGNVRGVAEQLVHEGIATPARVNGKGRAYGGVAWSRGQIYKLLSNPIYIGMIEHKGERYQGLHLPIIDPDSWERVQATLAENLQGHRSGAYARDASLLAGKVEDGAGRLLVADHASRRGVRYRYYVGGRDTGPNLRIPARELEALVIARIDEALADPLALAVAASLPLAGLSLDRGGMRTRALARNRAFLDALIAKVRILPQTVEVLCHTAGIARLLGATAPEQVRHSR
ncbi:recombinase family protein [Sphingomonas sp.]|uniref:recombinase family protein n=1 Tax=Sphingomonas sp. TaxID=28214 RepID=UPI002DD69422|nr:recombinase family protein [Sphingomonas sp.]